MPDSVTVTETSETQPVSILITSVSKKVPMVSAVRKAADKYHNCCQVFGADSNNKCSGRFFVDGFWTIPNDNVLRPAHVISWCRQHNVSVIVPSRDGELAFWARYRESLSEAGISVMVSDPQVVANCTDKLEFYKYFSACGFPIIRTMTEADQTGGDRWVVKERFGAGSAKAGIDLNPAAALEHSLSLESPIFQPYVQGDEISADVYVTFDGAVKGVVLRRRDVVVDGESQVTTTFHESTIEQLCIDMAQSAGFRGHVMFQIIIDAESRPHVIECNCRFGGASTLSIDSGLDSFYWFILESSGIDINDVKVELVPVPMRQIRYAQDKVVAV